MLDFRRSGSGASPTGGGATTAASKLKGRRAFRSHNPFTFDITGLSRPFFASASGFFKLASSS